jgi:minor tail protein Z (GPZ)
MPLSVSVKWDRSGLAALETGPLKRAAVRALRKAGATALRDMRSEASKRIRQRKRIKPSYISRALTLRRAKGSDIAAMSWAVNVSGEPVPLVAYPHRQTKKGVSVEVNRGKRTLVKGAFVASMKSGHEGVFRRRGKARLPIKELRGSRPVDALLHEGEADAVAARGGKSFADTFTRVLPMEIGKGK